MGEVCVYVYVYMLCMYYMFTECQHMLLLDIVEAHSCVDNTMIRDS